MSDTKFTKGEWKVERFVNDKGFEISFNEDGEVVADFVYEEADAHLIAAAPEMYDAINHVLKMQLRGFIVLGNEATGKLQKSLAKARGE